MQKDFNCLDILDLQTYPVPFFFFLIKKSSRKKLWRTLLEPLWCWLGLALLLKLGGKKKRNRSKLHSRLLSLGCYCCWFGTTRAAQCLITQHNFTKLQNTLYNHPSVSNALKVPVSLLARSQKVLQYLASVCPDGELPCTTAPGPWQAERNRTSPVASGAQSLAGLADHTSLVGMRWWDSPLESQLCSQEVLTAINST